MSEKVQLIKDFNDVLLSLTQNIAAVCPKSIIGTNITDIEKELTRTSNFVKFIDFFCIKVLQYKDRIDSGDESFFMEKDYSNDVEGVVDPSTDVISHVVSLKSVWKDFKKENKEIVIENMQILCALALEYYILCNP